MNEKLTLLAVHAHPDDEAIGTGGVLARYAAEEVRTVLVCATRGEEGEIVDPSLDQEATKRQLGEVREAELRCACGVLGVHELHFLGYRDSGMSGTAENRHPAAFCNADLAEATGRLVKLIRTLRPQVLVSYNEYGGYGHPDHIMSHRVTAAAFEAAGDPSCYRELGIDSWQPAKLYETAMPRSMFDQLVEFLRRAGGPSPFDRPDMNPERFTTPDSQITTRVDVREYLPKKRESLVCHRTQIAAESFFFQLPEDLVREGMGYEHFVLRRSSVSSSLPESDLFAGLK